MFTGLVEEVGVIAAVDILPHGRRYRIHCKTILDDIKTGDSIAVCGACQTVEKFDAESFTIFSIPETLSVTNFTDLSVGSRVNLERALRFGDRVGGHLVQGHVEGVAIVESITAARAHDIILHYNSPYIIPKGSVTLDGISLTVMEKIDTQKFRVQIIPETLTKTNIGDWRAQKRINIEVDYIIKSLALATPKARPLASASDGN